MSGHAGQVTGVVVCHVGGSCVEAEQFEIHAAKVGGPRGVVVAVCGGAREGIKIRTHTKESKFVFGSDKAEGRKRKY